jgi:hypothetical protein
LLGEFGLGFLDLIGELLRLSYADVDLALQYINLAIELGNFGLRRVGLVVIGVGLGLGGVGLGLGGSDTVVELVGVDGAGGTKKNHRRARSGNGSS